MGIRDTSYYGFSTVFRYGPTLANATYPHVAIADIVTLSDKTLIGVRTYNSATLYEYLQIYSLSKNGASSSYDTGVAEYTNDSRTQPENFVHYNSATQKAYGLTTLGLYSSSNNGENFSYVNDDVYNKNVFSFIAGNLRAFGSSNTYVYIATNNPFGPEGKILTSSNNGVLFGIASGSSISAELYQQFAFKSTTRVFASTISSPGTLVNNVLNDVGAYAGQTAYIYSASVGGPFVKIANASYATPSASWNKMGALMTNSTATMLYHAGSIKKGNGRWAILIRSSSNDGGSWGSASYGDSTTDYFGVAMARDSKDNIYVAGLSGSNSFLLASFNAGLSWRPVASQVGQTTTGFYIDSYDDMWWSLTTSGSAVSSGSTNFLIVKKGRLQANSASLGPTMLNTSFGYVQSEISGVVNEKFKLNNVSEFPHSSGLFQMRNVVLGTKTSGKIGSSEDSIIQVNHVGSTVYVVWPKQDNALRNVKGYGDFSAGQAPGLLNTSFVPGDFFDVTEFDHLSLYCYLQKNVSGSLDDVILRLERRPLTGLPFAAEQTITLENSSSYTTEGTLRDEVYRKVVDYGDLSIREISFPIDIPLTNTKEIRISCRHKNGQSNSQNKNFIVWGRLIKSSKDTNET